MSRLVEIAQWFRRGRFFNFINVFLLFHNYLPLEKGRALYLNKLESPSPKKALCQVWLKLALWFLRRRFLNFINVFPSYIIISPWKRSGPFIWKKLESPSPRNALFQVWLKSAQWFWWRRWQCEKFMTTPTTTTTDKQKIFEKLNMLNSR